MAGRSKMMAEVEFHELVARLRAGDPDAIRRCVELFGPEIRRAARVRLRDPSLRRMVDSIDVAQSVFRRFLARYREGEYHLDCPEDLLALLVTMARNRVTDWARKCRVEQRLEHAEWLLEDEGAHRRSDARHDDPSTDLERRELAELVQRRMAPFEFDLFCRRLDGASWASIAGALGSSPEALRKRLERALVRVRVELRSELGEEMVVPPS